jgi:predicted peptidase
MKTAPLIGLVSALAVTGCANMQEQETGFLDRTVTVDGESHSYQVFVPRNYTGNEQWPVILFLHGAGERGSDGLKQTQVGLGRAIRLQPENWPAIAIFPQVPADESWLGGSAQTAMAALEATMDEFSVDQSRQYLTGLSLGGNGTWYLGYQHTERFAALLAVCGFVALRADRAFVPDADNPYAALARDLAGTPVWIVHGDADVVVPVEESRRMASELRSLGADVHYTELPGVNHNSWDAAYSDPEIISWLFAQAKER